MSSLLKYTILVSVALVLPITPSFAQDDANGGCEKLADDVWGCPLPTKPPGPPTCHIFGQSLICSAPVAVTPLPERKAPSNCGWSRKANKYVCW